MDINIHNWYVCICVSIYEHELSICVVYVMTIGTVLQATRTFTYMLFLNCLYCYVFVLVFSVH